MSFDYIRVDDILAIHADQIERYGGGDGIRDPGLLEAALFRLQTGYYPTLVDEAAALIHQVVDDRYTTVTLTKLN